MGIKLDNRHVLHDDPAAVVAALADLARAHGFEAVAEGAMCDHELVVATFDAAPRWTSFYGSYANIDWELSGALDTRVLWTGIFDSDTVALKLFSEGKAVDVFCNNPDYLDEPARGQPRRWDSLCVPGKTWRDVQRVFRSAREAPEQALVDLGALVGLAPVSFYEELHDKPTFRRVLRFRAPPRPARRILQGPAALRLPNDTTARIPWNGQSIEVGLFASSYGGHADALEIACGGSAVTEGLVEINGVRFRYTDGSRTERGWLVAQAVAASSGFAGSDGSPPLVADNEPGYPLSVTVTAKRKGHGELVVTCRPRGPDGIETSARVMLTLE